MNGLLKFVRRFFVSMPHDATVNSIEFADMRRAISQWEVANASALAQSSRLIAAVDGIEHAVSKDDWMR